MKKNYILLFGLALIVGVIPLSSAWIPPPPIDTVNYSRTYYENDITLSWGMLYRDFSLTLNVGVDYQSNDIVSYALAESHGSGGFPLLYFHYHADWTINHNSVEIQMTWHYAIFGPHIAFGSPETNCYMRMTIEFNVDTHVWTYSSTHWESMGYTTCGPGNEITVTDNR